MTGATGLDRAVDTRFGPVVHVRRQPRPPELPVGFAAYGATVADSRFLGPWQADPFAFGASLTDPAAARAAAIGEAVERYCGNAVPPDLPRHSYRELLEAGVDALDPGELPLYSKRQYARPGFPFVAFTAELPGRWVRARELGTDEVVHIPASLAYLNFHNGPYATEPRTHFMILPGLATGSTRRSAIETALAEVCERDAVTTWWQRGTPSSPVPETATAVLRLADSPPRSNISYHLFGVPSDLDVPVVGALLDDGRNGVVTMGSACHQDIAVAARKAVTEAIQLRSFSVDLLDPGSPVRRGFAAGHRDRSVLLPFRTDRAYLDDHVPDFPRAVDFASHAQLWLDPRMRVHLDRILRAPSEPLPARPEITTTLAEQVLGRGYRILVVDLTTSDIASLGLHVVRVVVPGLYPNAPAAIPFLGGDRLYRARHAVLEEDELVRAPLPAI